METVEVKNWKITQFERGDGTSVYQVYRDDKVTEVFVADTMTKQKLKAYLNKKVKDADPCV